MADVLIRDFPDELLKKVDKSAKKDRRTRPQEIIAIIEREYAVKV